MTLFFKKYSNHFLLAGIGMISLLLLVVLLDIHQQTLIFPDATNYNESATNLYWYVRGHCNRPLLMAAIYGFPLVFGASDYDLYLTAQFINGVFCLMTILLMYEIFIQYVSTKVAFWLSILFICFFGISLYNFHFLAETPFLFFLVASFYFLQKYRQTKVFKWLVFALSIIVLSMLIKPASKFFALLMLLYFIRELLRNYTRKIMIVLYSSIGLCLIQAIGIKYQFGDFTISYIDSVTFYNYIFSKADCYRKGTDFDQMNNPRADYLFTFKVHEQKKIVKADIIEQLQNNKINLVKAYLHNFIWNTASANVVPITYSNINNSKRFEITQSFLIWLTKYQNRIMTILGIVLSLIVIRKYYNKDIFLLFVAVFILYIIGISGISSNQGDRFHIITYPFTLILIANYLKSRPFFAPPQK